MTQRVFNAVLVDTEAQQDLLAQGVETTKVIRLDDLRLPIHFCLGQYEAATPEELNELIADLDHEARRQETWPA